MSSKPKHLEVSTNPVSQGGGIQDVKFIPNNPESAALATAVHLGQVWIIYPFRKDASGKQGVAELLYDLGPKARDTTAIYSDLTKDGKFAYCKPSPTLSLSHTSLPTCCYPC